MTKPNFDQSQLSLSFNEVTMPTKVDSPVLGLSKSKKEAIAFVKQHSDFILSNMGHIPVVQKRVDWSKPRGQGKRVGAMVKGGMCTLMSSVTYDGVDMSQFDELMLYHANEIILRDACRCARYAGAYNGGCNHLEAMAFAIRPNFTL